MKYQVIIQVSVADKPQDFEMSASMIVANYFKTDIIFQRPGQAKTPDLIINGETWELKSPKGNSKNTIHNNFSTARKQSKNIIMDLRRCKMNEQKAITRICNIYKKRRQKKDSLLIIKKDNSILVNLPNKLDNL